MKKDAVSCYELTILDESDTIIVTLFSADCHVYFKKGCFICLSCKCADRHCGKKDRRGWRPRHPAEHARYIHPAKKNSCRQKCRGWHPRNPAKYDTNLVAL